MAAAIEIDTIVIHDATTETRAITSVPTATGRTTTDGTTIDAIHFHREIFLRAIPTSHLRAIVTLHLATPTLLAIIRHATLTRRATAIHITAVLAAVDATLTALPEDVLHRVDLRHDVRRPAAAVIRAIAARHTDRRPPDITRRANALRFLRAADRALHFRRCADTTISTGDLLAITCLPDAAPDRRPTGTEDLRVINPKIFPLESIKNVFLNLIFSLFFAGFFFFLLEHFSILSPLPRVDLTFPRYPPTSESFLQIYEFPLCED